MGNDDCAAFGNEGYSPLVAVDAGGSWASETLADPSGGEFQGTSVSCSSLTYCVAGGWGVSDANGPIGGDLYTGAIATPSVSVSVPSSGMAGSAISASSVAATVSSGSSPSGTITFKVFGPQSSAPSDCSGGTTVGTASVSGDGTYNPSAGFAPSSPGDYWWYVSYAGDSNNNQAGSTCGASMAETAVAAASPPPQQTLSVSLAGTGSGAVISSPAGISCPGSCSHSYAQGTVVTLTATPGAGSAFTWSGACLGSDSCTVTMSAGQAVTATFIAVTSKPKPKPTVSGAKLNSKSFKAKQGVTLKLALSVASNVRVVINQAGRKGTCKASARKDKQCTLTVKTLDFSGRAGVNSFKLKTTGLKPGGCTMVITAGNTAGMSAKIMVTFKIKE